MRKENTECENITLKDYVNLKNKMGYLIKSMIESDLLFNILQIL